MPGRRTLARAALGATLVGALAAGCSADAAPDPAPVVVAAPVAVAKVAAPPAPARPDLATLPVLDPLHVVPGLPGSEGLAPRRNEDPSLGTWQTAVVVRDTAAYDQPAGTPLGVVPAVTLDVPTILPVVDARPGWLHVLLAVRGALPSQDVAQVNGRSAWIRTADAGPSGTSWSIHVDTAAQTIAIDDGSTVRTFPVKATGSPATPTPSGLSFLLGPRWIEPGTTTPRVLPLSTQSESIDHYDKPTGTAVTAIHTTTLRGTGEVSNGCVRVSDEVIEIVWQAPAGTIVTVD